MNETTIADKLIAELQELKTELKNSNLSGDFEKVYDIRANIRDLLSFPAATLLLP